MSDLGNRLAIVDALMISCLMAGTVSCRQIVGIQDNPPGDGSVGGLQYGTPECAMCANEHCEDASAACADATDTLCATYESCLGGCNGDAGCRSQCTIRYPVNAAPVSNLSACLAKNCADQCGLACGGFAAYLSEPDASAACESCLQTSPEKTVDQFSGNGCSFARDCGQSAACDAFWRCWRACVTPDCQFSCEQQYDVGAALFKPLYDEFSHECADACGYGSYWACAQNAQHFGQPGEQSPNVTVSDVVYDLSSHLGVPDAQVAICDHCPCNSPPTQGYTDADGGYTLQFPQLQPTSGTGIPFCTQVSAPGYLTALTYWGYVPVEPVITGQSSLLSNTAWGIQLVKPDAQAADINPRFGASYDPTRAIFVAANVHDCLGSPVGVGAANVSIHVRDPLDAMVAYNAIDAGPDAWPTVPTGTYPPFYSVALFFNVPVDARLVTLTASVPGLASPVSTVTVAVAPNDVTELGMPPTPPQ